MNDLISRQAAIEALGTPHGILYPIRTIEELPSAQPERKPIDYRDCADALLKLWMDNILTDGEYYKIIDKLNAHQLEIPYEEEGE